MHTYRYIYIYIEKYIRRPSNFSSRLNHFLSELENPCPKRLCLYYYYDRGEIETSGIGISTCGFICLAFCFYFECMLSRRSTLGKSASALLPRCLTLCLIRVQPTSGCPPRAVLLSPPPAVSLLETIIMLSYSNPHTHTHTHTHTLKHPHLLNVSDVCC